MRKPAAAARLLAALLPAMAAAQTDTGSLTGLVSDASGAVVQHAAVEVTNQGTGISARVSTNEKGFYFVPDLRPGVFRVSASHTGFKRSEQSDVALQIGRDVGEEHVFGVTILFRQARLEFREAVQLCGQRHAFVQVL